MYILSIVPGTLWWCSINVSCHCCYYHRPIQIPFRSLDNPKWTFKELAIPNQSCRIAQRKWFSSFRPSSFLDLPLLYLKWEFWLKSFEFAFGVNILSSLPAYQMVLFSGLFFFKGREIWNSLPISSLHWAIHLWGYWPLFPVEELDNPWHSQCCAIIATI